MSNYHQTVTINATPFREFTKWCDSDSIPAMDDIQDLRRAALRTYIKENKYSGNAFAIKLGRQASFFSDLFRGEKSFRESLAEKLEKEIKAKGLPQIRLIDPIPPISASVNQEFEKGVSGAPILIAREFSLEELQSMRAHLVDILVMIDNKMTAIEIKNTGLRKIRRGPIVSYRATHPDSDHAPHYSAHEVAEADHSGAEGRQRSKLVRRKRIKGIPGNDQAHEVS